MAIARDQALSAYFRAPSSVTRLSRGHVNDSWLVAHSGHRYVLQLVNRHVFRDPMIAVRNFIAVSQGLRSRHVRTVRVRATRAGDPWFVDDDGGQWRAYHYVDGRIARPASRTTMRDVGYAFGAFARALAAIDTPFEPAIARFHDLGHRARQLDRSVTRDRAGRARALARDTDRLRSLLDRVRSLDEFTQWTRQPPRVVHNDAKPANLVLHPPDRPCVIDLDTVATGRLGNDVGELVRSIVPSDERPLDTERIAAMWSGFVDGCAEPLAPAEQSVLPIAGVVLAVELACRYLADHLDGDRYFALGPADSTLERARMQMRRADRQLCVLDELRRRAENLLSKRA